MDAPLADVGRDLAWMRGSLGTEARAVLLAAPSARVVAPPFAGEGGAELSGVDLAGRFAEVEGLPPGALSISGELDWSPEAESLTSAAGLATHRPT